MQRRKPVRSTGLGSNFRLIDDICAAEFVRPRAGTRLDVGSTSGSSATTGTAQVDVTAARAALVQAAEAEGALIWYSTEAQPINDAVVAAFQAKYKIKVTVLRLAAGDMISRYTTERRVGQAAADLITGGGPEEMDAHPDWYLKLSEEIVPEFANYPTACSAGQTPTCWSA